MAAQLTGTVSNSGLFKDYHNIESGDWGTSLVAQWIGLRAPNVGGLGSIPGEGTRSHMHAATKSSHATTKKPTCLT